MVRLLQGLVGFGARQRQRFQSHNGAIAAYLTEPALSWLRQSFNPTMVRLLQYTDAEVSLHD